MIRTEIDITNPQKVEVIATGEIGYVVSKDDSDMPFFVSDKKGIDLGWFKPEDLRPLEDRLVFDVDVDGFYTMSDKSTIVGFRYKGQDFPDVSTHTFQVIATPKKEKSLEDMTKEELIQMVKQLKK